MKTYMIFGFAIFLVLSFDASDAVAQDIRERHHNGDEVINGNIDGRAHIVFKGEVGRLIIKGKIDGQSTLDLRGLKAGVVFIDGKIDGKSRVMIGNVGVVEIRGKIDGQSIVTVEHCREFIVAEKIDGGQETVVTLSYSEKFEVKDGIKDAKVTATRR